MGAYDAYRAGNPIKLASHAQKIEGHVLDALDRVHGAFRSSWRTPRPRRCKAFFSAYGNTYVGERCAATG